MKRPITLCQARALLALYACSKGRLPQGDPLALWEGAPPSDEAGRMVAALADLGGVPVRRKGQSLSVRLPDRSGLPRASNPGGDEDDGDSYLLRVRIDRRQVPNLAAAVKGLRGVTEEGFILLEAIEQAADMGHSEARPPSVPRAPVTRERLLREIAENHGSITLAARKLGLGFYEALRLRDAAPGAKAKATVTTSAGPGSGLSRESVEAAFLRNDGSIKATASELGVARSTVRDWLRKPLGSSASGAEVTPDRVKGAVIQSGGSLTAAAALLGVGRSVVRGIVEANDPEGTWAAEGKQAKRRPVVLPRASNPGVARQGEPRAVDPRDVQSALDGLADPDDPRGPESLVADTVGAVRLMRLEDLQRLDPGVKRFRHFRPGALARLEPLQLRRAIATFRPDVSWDERAWRWRDRDGSWRFPPAVILTTPEGHRSLADGLGRYALAVGLGFEALPVVDVRARYRGGPPEDGEGDAARALQAVMDEIGLKGPKLDRRSNPAAMTDHELMELFVRERGRFAKKYPRVAEASIEVSEAPCSSASGQCGFRNVAYCTWSGPDGAKKYQRVVVVRRLLAMPRENVLGVIRHELGHLSDDRASQGGGERRADAIAERVTGARVLYDANDLQAVGACKTPPCRGSRPDHLHQ